MMKKRFATWLAFASAAWPSVSARAVDVETHGFLTAGYAISDTAEAYLSTVTKEGSFSALSNAGVQVSATLTDRAQVKLQLIARGRPSRSLGVDLDLAQGSYMLTPGHQLLVGILRLPIFLVSDYRLVGALYPWNVPPPELYELLPPGAVGSNETFTGANLLSRWAQFGDWALESEVYAGGSTQRITPPGREVDAAVKRLFGANLSLGSDRLRLRLSYLNALHQETTLRLGAGPIVSEDTSLGTIQFVAAGAKWEPDRFLVQGEAAWVSAESLRFRSVGSYYATVGMRFWDRRLLAHGTVGGILASDQNGSNLAQNSVGAGLNFFFAEGLVAKVDATRVLPQARGPAAGPGAAAGPGGQAAAQAEGGGVSPSRPGSALTVVYASISAAF